MIRAEAVFGCADSLTPQVAAKLTQTVERYDVRMQLQCGGKRVLLDSLIGILSLECARGTRLTVVAEGPEEEAAAGAVVKLLEG